MSTATEPDIETKPDQQLVTFSVKPITYEVTKAEAERVASAAMMLRVNDVNDKVGLDRCQKEQSKLARMTSLIEKERVAQKRDYLEGGRQVDAIAKGLSAPLEKAKAHLQEQRDIVKRHEAKLAEEKAQREKEAEERKQAVTRDRLQALQQCGKSYMPEDVADLSPEDFNSLLASEQADKAKRDELAANEKREQERVAEANRIGAERLAKERAEAETRIKRMRARAGMLAEQNFAHSLSGEQLADLTPEQWDDLIGNARLAKRRADHADAELRANLERQRSEQAAAQAKIDAENKRQLMNSRIDALQAQVPIEIANDMDRIFAAAGLPKTGTAIAEMTDEEYAIGLASIRNVVKLRQEATEQARLDAIAEQERIAAAEKAAAEAVERENQERERNRPDCEKLRAYVDAVAAIEFPAVSVSAAKAASRIEEMRDEFVIDAREIAGQLIGDSVA